MREFPGADRLAQDRWMKSSAASRAISQFAEQPLPPRNESSLKLHPFTVVSYALVQVLGKPMMGWISSNVMLALETCDRTHRTVAMTARFSNRSRMFDWS